MKIRESSSQFNDCNKTKKTNFKKLNNISFNLRDMIP